MADAGAAVDALRHDVGKRVHPAFEPIARDTDPQRVKAAGNRDLVCSGAIEDRDVPGMQFGTVIILRERCLTIEQEAHEEYVVLRLGDQRLGPLDQMSPAAGDRADESQVTEWIAIHP